MWSESSRKKEKMAKDSNTCGLATLLLPLLLLLLGSVIFKTEAIRPLKGEELSRTWVTPDRLFEKRSLLGIRINDSGPSPSGPGHPYKVQGLTGESYKSYPRTGVEHNSISESGPSPEGPGHHRYKVQGHSGESYKSYPSPSVEHK